MVEAVFLHDISGHNALIDSSGALLVDIQTGTVTSSVSGQTVVLGSGSAAPLSGVNVREVSAGVVTPTLSGAFVVTANSGGNTLFSGGPLQSVTMRNASGNAPMYIGGSGVVVNGIGLPLYANESLTLKVSNFNLIAAVAVTSGQSLLYIGLQ